MHKVPICIVDQSGVQYLTDSNGCIIVPQSIGGSGLSSITTGGCIIGDGTSGNPVTISLDPSGSLSCSPSGFLVSSSLVEVSTSGNGIGGNGKPGNPIKIIIHPSGGLSSNTGGIFIEEVFTAGCLTGKGTASEPVTLVLDPSGGLSCSSSGLFVSTPAPSGGGLTAVSVSECLAGDGTPGDPIVIVLDPSGGIACGVSGLTITGLSGSDVVVTSVSTTTPPIALTTAVHVVNASGQTTHNLPFAANANENQRFTVKRLGPGNVVVGRQVGDNIDGVAADWDFDVNGAVQGSSREFVSDGVNTYYII